MKKFIILLGVTLGFVCVVCAQGVGIGTANPRAKLHVAGDLRIDSVKNLLNPKRIAVLDTSGIIYSLSIDSFSAKVQSYYAEVETPTNTSTSVLQPRVSITVPPGTYLLTAYFEGYNPSIPSGVRGEVTEGSVEIAYGALYSDVNTYSPWNMMKRVVPAVTTTYTLLWASWPSGNPSYIRRARINALKIQ
jgi:hypothetical protein